MPERSARPRYWRFLRAASARLGVRQSRAEVVEAGGSSASATLLRFLEAMPLPHHGVVVEDRRWKRGGVEGMT